jgi:hypothetical protein
MNRKNFQQIALLLLSSTSLSMCTKVTEPQSVSNATIDTVGSTTELHSDEVPTGKTPQYDYETLFKLETYLTDSAIVEDSIQVIDFTCAVLIYPTSAQIDSMIADNGEENFYTIADDNNWYQGMAIQKIDSAKVATFSAELPFLRFEGKDNLWTLDIRKKGLPEWNIIFFNPTKEPKIISGIDLSIEQVREYFEISKP